METFAQIVGVVILAILAVCLLAILMAVPVWLLWNWVAVAVLGLKEITLLQALGLSLLSSFLFKSSTVSSKS